MGNGEMYGEIIVVCLVKRLNTQLPPVSEWGFLNIIRCSAYSNL